MELWSISSRQLYVYKKQHTHPDYVSSLYIYVRTEITYDGYFPAELVLDFSYKELSFHFAT